MGTLAPIDRRLNLGGQKLFNLRKSEAERAQAAVVANNYLAYAFDISRNEFYYYTAVLGAGSFGRVYAATTRIGAPTPDVAVKVFAPKRVAVRDIEPNSDRMRREEPMRRPLLMRVRYNELDSKVYDASFIEREWRISQILRRRATSMRMFGNFCEESVICARSRFYSKNEKLGFIVFPYKRGTALDYHLVEQVHEGMRRYRETVRSLRLLPNETVEEFQARKINPLLRRMQQVQDRDARALVRGQALELAELLERATTELQTIRERCMKLTLDALDAIAALHRVHVYHRDIKPDNFLVSIEPMTADSEDESDDASESDSYVEYVPRLRAIDLGLACAEPLPPDLEAPQIFAADEPFVVCSETFRVNDYYQDPLLKRFGADSKFDSFVEDPEFRLTRKRVQEIGDAYALGKTLQHIWDDRTYSQNPLRVNYPIVRPSEFMIDGVYELIVRLTGESTERDERRANVVRLQTLVDELSLRISVRTAANRFASIVEQYIDDASSSSSSTSSSLFEQM